MSFPPPSRFQAHLLWLALTGLAIAILTGLAVALVWGLGKVISVLSPVLWPLAIAGVMAYLLDPVVDFLEGKSVPRPRAILLVFGLALLMILTLFSSIVPQLVTESQQLTARIPAYAARLQQRLQYWANHPPPVLKNLLARENSHQNATITNTPSSGSSTNVEPAPPAASEVTPARPIDREALQQATGWLAKALPDIGAWFFGQVGRVASWFGVLAGLALVPVYTFYFLLEKRGISSRWSDYLPLTDSRFKTEMVFVLTSINNYLIAFFRGQVLVAICDGILYGLGFLIIGLPYALLIGVTAMFLTIIPFLGAMVICASALIIALVQFGDWLHPLLVLVVFGCVQTLEGLVISPKIMGDRVGLHPVMIIVALMVGTTLLGGLLGGILAIPLTAALRVIMFRYVWKRPVLEQIDVRA